MQAARIRYLSGDVPEPDDNANQRPPTILTKAGLTALLHAARQGHIGTVLALLEGGAEIDQVSASDGTSPLLMAAINAQFDLALELIARGADPNLASTLNGVTPLWAVVNAEWQPRTRFPQPQEHALQVATYLDVMRALLQAGADPGCASHAPPVVHGVQRVWQPKLWPRRHAGLHRLLAGGLRHGSRRDATPGRARGRSRHSHRGAGATSGPARDDGGEPRGGGRHTGGARGARPVGGHRLDDHGTRPVWSSPR